MIQAPRPPPPTRAPLGHPGDGPHRGDPSSQAAPSHPSFARAPWGRTSSWWSELPGRPLPPELRSGTLPHLRRWRGKERGSSPPPRSGGGASTGRFGRSAAEGAVCVPSRGPPQAPSSRSKPPGRPLPPELCSGTLPHFVVEGKTRVRIESQVSSLSSVFLRTTDYVLSQTPRAAPSLTAPPQARTCRGRRVQPCSSPGWRSPRTTSRRIRRGS